MSKHVGTKGAGSSILIMLLAGCMAASMAFVGVTFHHLTSNASDEREWIKLATEVQVDSQKLSKSASEAALGILEAFSDLGETHDQMTLNMRILNAGSEADDLPPLPLDVAPQVSSLVLNWNRISASATSITEREPMVIELANSTSAFLEIIPSIQASADRAVRQLIESGAPNPQVFVASTQMVLADRMLRRVTEILQNGSNSARAADDLRKEMSQFEQVMTALTRGNQRMGVTPVRNSQTLSTLSTIRKHYQSAKPHLTKLLDSSPRLFELRSAADEIFLESQSMFDNAGNLSRAVGDLPRSRVWPSIQSATAGLIVLLVLVALAIGLVIVSARRRADDAYKHNRRTQKAIMRLLDELSSLADGDLTAKATVTDEITGAIADAVNYAVEQLRGLVTGINRTAVAVAETAETTRASTSRLADAANEQAGQVDRATGKIKEMSKAFTGMAERSQESRETAMDSVKIAHAGADKVRKTIFGMDTIREQIQETSKRIKRLGESTQEIGDIVSMINDIAEQTNVLALNAAIQAASAGSTGQGFAVVADEVQQLAESATNATRRISSLVQTIQADTAEAVKSMESTTSEVVHGARLAQDAGQALVQVEEASNNLSSLIDSISNEALKHSEQAIRISELMDGIRKVSEKTSEGTDQTAHEVSELADLVLQLRESVADFKLPGSTNVKAPAPMEQQA